MMQPSQSRFSSRIDRGDGRANCEVLTMSSIRSFSFLRRVLLVDAVSSGAMGLGLLAGADALSGVLRLPASLLTEAGIVLLPFAAFVGLLASREAPARTAVWFAIAMNVLWAIDSILLLVSGWVAPNAFGHAFVITQAAFVVVLAELEYIGLRRSTALAA